MSTILKSKRRRRRKSLPPLEGNERRVCVFCERKKNKPRMALGVCEVCKKNKKCDEYYNAKLELIGKRNVG